MAYLRPIRAGIELRKSKHPVDEYIQMKTVILKVPLRCCFKVILEGGLRFHHETMDKVKMKTAGGFLYQDANTDGEKIYFKLDKHARYFFRDTYLSKSENRINGEYSAILNENLYFIVTNGKKWLLYKNGDDPIIIGDKRTNNIIKDLSLIPNLSIHPLVQTEKNTFNIVFQLISIFQGICPSPEKINKIAEKDLNEVFITIRKVLGKCILSTYAIMYKVFYTVDGMPNEQSLAFLTKLPIVSAMMKGIELLQYKKDYRGWYNLYVEGYEELFRLRNILRLIAFIKTELIQFRLYDNIDYIHSTRCLEGDKEGCNNITDAKLNDLKETLKSNDNIGEKLDELKEGKIGYQMIRKYISEDYKDMESLIDFFNRARTIPFLNGSKYDVNVYLEDQKEDCAKETEILHKNIITNRTKRARETFTFLFNSKQIKKYLIEPYRKNPPRRRPISLPDMENITHKNSIQNEVLSRLNIPYYRGINNRSVMNTLRYMFYYVNKGLYVSIRNNAIKSFIPFSGGRNKNGWTHRLPRLMEEFDGKIGSLKNPTNDTYYGLKAKYIEKGVRGFYRDNIYDNVERWSVNGCLVSNSYSREKFRDAMLPELLHMFKVLCLEHNIPDVDFFVNTKDFATLKKDKTSIEEHIYDSKTIPLKNYNYDQYAPILGFNTTDEHADIPIPNMDDWRRSMKLYFGTQCNGYANLERTPEWDTKKPTAIFRGAATGCGTTIHNNQRIKLAYISKNWEKDEKRKDYLNAGISTWAVRDKKKMGEPMRFVRPMTGDPELDENPLTVHLRLKEYVPMDRQIEYKYVVYVDGNAAAYRYLTLMDTGSTILKVESMYGYKMWFYDELKGYDIRKGGEVTDHDHVIVDENLENLEDVIVWCREHDNEARLISENAKRKSTELFSYNGILEYLANLLKAISMNTGKYIDNDSEIYEFKREKEEEGFKQFTRQMATEMGEDMDDDNSLTLLEDKIKVQRMERGLLDEIGEEENEDDDSISPLEIPSKIRKTPDKSFRPITKNRIKKRRVKKRVLGQLVDKKDRDILRNIEGMRYI
jgi:hypothetical protein